MSLKVHLAIDTIGGDFGTEVTLPAVAAALESDPHLSLTLVGSRDRLATFQKNTPEKDRLNFVYVDGEVSTEDTPKQVIRQGASSSMGAAIALVDQDCQGAVSSGSTAALMTLGKSLLGMQKNIDRPVLATAIPSRDNHTWLLDVGANLECSAEKLLKLGILGTLLARAQDGTQSPRVGLLNVGHENSKGTTVIKTAAEQMKTNEQVHLVGYAEGGDLFGDKFDVVVADGFSGNVALKTAEGAAFYIFEHVRNTFRQNFFAKIGAWIMSPQIKRIKAGLNPSRHNGAPLLGLQGLVVKSHGVADIEAFKCAIELAAKLARSGLVSEIGDSMGTLAEKPETANLGGATT